MKYEELISMVKEVSGLGVSGFEYSEGDMKISLKFPKADGWGPDAGERSGNTRGLNDAKRESETQRREDGSQVAENKSTSSGLEEATVDIVKSPLVGTFYAAPSEDAEPFVKPGDHVKKGQVLAIVEAMKLMNEIESECDGVVDTVLVKNGEAVGYGQPLFKIGVRHHTI